MSQETIEKKLAYLEETKHMIGDALITKGQTLDSETPFRDYVQKVLDIETGYDTRDATAVASEVLKGKTFYNSQGKVEGTLVPKTGDIKKFNTIEEMENDTNALEGDLAVVYRKETQNWDGSSAITSLTFPKTVILPSAMTGSCYGYASGNTWLDFDGNVSATSAYFYFMGNDHYSITYTSTDGITYTRTDSYAETITLSDQALTLRVYEWSDVCGYFMQIAGMYFEGLYQNLPDTTKSYYITSKGNRYQIILPDGLIYSNKEGDSGGTSATWDTSSGYFYLTDFVVEDGKIQSANMWGAGGTSGRAYLNGEYLACSSSYSTIYKRPIAFNWDKGIVYYNGDKIDIKGEQMLTLIPASQEYINLYDIYADDTPTTIVIPHVEVDHDNIYVVAPTQLTLDNVNQLLPGKIAYGKNGLIEGDNTIWKQIPDDQFVSNYLGLDISDLSKVGNYSSNKALLQTELPIPSVYAIKSKAETTDYDIPLSVRRKISLPNIYSGSYIVRIDGRYFVLYYTDSKLGIREWFLDSDNNITEGDWVYSSTFTPYDSSRVITRVYEHNLYIASTSHNTNLVTILKYDVAAAKITIEKTVNVSTTSPVLIDINAATNTFWFLANKMGPIKSCNYSTGVINTLTGELNTQYGFYEHFTSMGDNYWMIVDSSTAYIMNRHTGELKTKPVPIDTYYGSTYTYYAQSIFEDKGCIYTIAQKGVVRYNPETDTIEVVAKNNSLSDGGRTYFNYFRLFEDSKYLYYLVHAQFTSSSGSNNYSNIYRLDTETLDVKQIILSDTTTVHNACIIPELDEHNCVNNDRFNLIAEGTNYHIRITAINSLFNADKPIIALSTGLYTTTDKINSIFEETTITPDEYQEALETAYSIRDDATE